LARCAAAFAAFVGLTSRADAVLFALPRRMTLYLHTAPAGEAIDYTEKSRVKKPAGGPLLCAD